MWCSVRSVSLEALKPSDTFARRHNSPTDEERQRMAEVAGFASLDALVDATVPASIRRPEMKLSKCDGGLTESQLLAHLKGLASKNKVAKSYIGMRVHGVGNDNNIRRLNSLLRNLEGVEYAWIGPFVEGGLR